MKKLIWKLRFAYYHHRLLRCGWVVGWENGGSFLEDVINGDTSECPKSCVDDEADEWRASC